MLTKIEIHSFRSCKDVVIDDIGSMLVLTGRNGAGKTNILRAIKWAADAATAAAADLKLTDNLRTAVEKSVSLYIHRGEKQFKLSLDNSTLDTGVQSFKESLVEIVGQQQRSLFSRKDAVVTLANGEIIELQSDSAALTAILSLRPGASQYEDLVWIYGYLKRVRYYTLEEPSETEENTPSITQYQEVVDFQKTNKIFATGKERTLVRLLSLAINRPDDYSELVSLLGPDGINIVDGITAYYVRPIEKPTKGGLSNSGPVSPALKEMEADAAKIWLFSYFGVPDGSFAYSDLSTGTRRLLRLFTYLIHDKPSLTLVEQPEDGIHAGLLRQTIPILRAYCDGNQFLFTSHSADVVNRFEPFELRLVDRTPFTTVRSLSKSECEALGPYLKDKGTFADFLELVT